MKCEDCIYYDKKIQTTIYKVEFHDCTYDKTEVKLTNNFALSCKHFEPKEDPWDSISK